MTLNPYQGLKLFSVVVVYSRLGVLMTLNPYQGLKQYQVRFRAKADVANVLMTLNPYQGLKLNRLCN